MSAVTKADLVHHLFMHSGVSKRAARKMTELFLEEIMAALEAGEAVKLPGFGVFTPQKKSARPGRNLQTNQPVLIEGRRVVTFKAAASLKQEVQQYDKSSRD